MLNPKKKPKVEAKTNGDTTKAFKIPNETANIQQLGVNSNPFGSLASLNPTGLSTLNPFNGSTGNPFTANRWSAQNLTGFQQLVPTTSALETLRNTAPAQPVRKLEYDR